MKYSILKLNSTTQGYAVIEYKKDGFGWGNENSAYWSWSVRIPNLTWEDAHWVLKALKALEAQEEQNP